MYSRCSLVNVAKPLLNETVDGDDNDDDDDGSGGAEDEMRRNICVDGLTVCSDCNDDNDAPLDDDNNDDGVVRGATIK